MKESTINFIPLRSAVEFDGFIEALANYKLMESLHIRREREPPKATFND
jgi:hypothetical protein